AAASLPRCDGTGRAASQRTVRSPQKQVDRKDLAVLDVVAVSGAAGAAADRVDGREDCCAGQRPGRTPDLLDRSAGTGGGGQKLGGSDRHAGTGAYRGTLA